jgi:glutamine synthetase
MTEEELGRWLAERDVETVITAGVDTHGILRGKRLPVDRLAAALHHGVALSDVLWVLDPPEEALVERPADHDGYFPTTANGYPDVFLRPEPATARPVPWHERTALLLGTFALPDGAPVAIDPRIALARVVERARALGFEPLVGIELEFYLLRETPASLAEKAYTRLEPLEPRPFTYTVYGGSRNEPVLGRIRRLLLEHGVPVEAANPETGPGQWEVNLRYAPALRAADDAVLLKNAVKEIAAQEGLLATFMAKPVADWAGNSCHLHLSLARDGGNAFWDAAAAGPSDVLRSFLAGVLDTMHELTPFFAPTPNAYSRFQPYSWAGTTATWAVDNRSTGLRLVLEGDEGTRLEQRQGGGDANPYLAVAAALAGGLHGLEHRLEPPPPTEADAYVLPAAEAPPLPRTLDAALDLLAASSRARELLGPDLVDHYVACKRAEAEAARLAVTDWDRRRYLELL